MENDNLVDQAKDIVRRIHSNTSVGRDTTRYDLGLVRDEIDELLDATPAEGDSDEG